MGVQLAGELITKTDSEHAVNEPTQKALDLKLAFYVQLGDRVGVQRILAAGGRINEEILINNIDAVTYAVFLQRADIVEDLLKSGANPNVPKENGARGFTPLITAARLGNPGAECCTILIRHGADTAAVDRVGNDALKIAAVNGYNRLCAALVEAGMDAEAHGDGVTTAKESAMELAEQHGRIVPVFQAIQELKVLQQVCATEELQDTSNEVSDRAGRPGPKAKRTI